MWGLRVGLIDALLVGVLGVNVGAQQVERPSAPLLRFPGEEVVIPTPEQGGRHMVQAYVGTEGPYAFFIDTGSTVSVIDVEVAAALGLPSTGTTAAGVPGGEMVDADIVLVSSLQVGELEISSLSAITIELAELTGGLMQGILGMDLFREVLLTLDPARDRALVSRGRLSPGAPGVMRLEPSDPAIGITINVAGRSLPAHIDTGSPEALTVSMELLDELPTLADSERSATAGLVGSSREVRSRTLDGLVRFAGMEFDGPRVGFMSPAPPVANVGSRLLDRLITRIDLSSGLVSFTPAEGVPEAGGTPRRLGLRLGGPGAGLSRVASVDPGSLAERAGLRAGDTIVGLNGRPMSEYDQAALATLFRSSEDLTFEVERDGDQIGVRIR